jgi:hypothetical protein
VAASRSRNPDQNGIGSVRLSSSSRLRAMTRRCTWLVPS